MSSKENPGSPKRFRTTDLTAVAGLIAVITGMLLFKSGADYVPAWIAWLVAPLLWYTGFAMLVGWAAGRMFAMTRGAQRRSQTEEAAEPARPTPAPIMATIEFAEHDFIFEQVRETA